jgi:hypothetical protein
VGGSTGRRHTDCDAVMLAVVGRKPYLVFRRGVDSRADGRKAGGHSPPRLHRVSRA